LINLDKTQQTLIKNGYNQLYKFKYKTNFYVFGLDLYHKSILYGAWNAWEPKNGNWSRMTYPSIRNFMLSSKKYTLRGLMSNRKPLSLKTELVSHEIFMSRVTYPSIRNFKLNSKFLYRLPYFKNWFLKLA
jgi:hypothetical protein